MLRNVPCFLLLIALTVLCVVPRAEAKRFSVNVTCAQAFDPQNGETAGFLFFWVPGWWAAMHNDPYINDWRRSLLTEAIVEACQNNKKARILQVVSGVKTLPKVPDNALEMGCADFLTSSPPWQASTVFWMQGYYAYKDGHADMETDYEAVFGKIEAQCRKNPRGTVAQAARKVLQ